MRDFQRLKARARLLAVVLTLISILAAGCSSGAEVEESEPSPSVSPTVANTSTNDDSTSQPSVETSSDITPTAVVSESENESIDDDSPDASSEDHVSEPEEATAISAASNTDQVGLFEYLDEVGNGVDDYDENAWVALIGTAMACADYVARPSEHTETLVLGSVLGLSETTIGPIAASYFDGAEDPAVFCREAFPESSKTLILSMLAGYSQVMCLFGGQEGFNFTPTNVMDFAEILVGYWGEDAPVSMSDFDGPEDYCAWIFDEENEHILELMESSDVSVLGAGE